MLSNYPAGAEFDPRAPYNEVEAPEQDFDMDVCYTLERSAIISSNNYDGGFRDDEGFYEEAEYRGDLEEDYKQQHLTPLQIIEAYKVIIQTKAEMLERTINEGLADNPRQIGRDIKECHRIIEDCEGWVETFEPL